MTAEKKREFIEKASWFHRIDVGDGIVTPGTQDCKATATRVMLPADLTGECVLDIGANDGFFSFECESRGAARIVALDTWERKYDGTRDIENIRFCKECRNSDIEIKRQNLFDQIDGRFNLVLFLGVLYHLQDMMAGLRRVAEATAKTGKAIIETHYVAGGDAPIARFYPGDELNDDPSNWWGPNAECVRLMAAAYFGRVRVIGTWCDRITVHAEEPRV